jgi:hypothetical protein
VVDTFTIVQFCVNAGLQYGAIVACSAAGNFSQIPSNVFLEPLFGLATGYQFIKAAKTVVEQRARVATLAAFLATSAGAAVTTDPATNLAVAGAIVTKIAYMRAMLVRGGGSLVIADQLPKYFLIPSLKDFEIMANPIKTPVVRPLLSSYQMKFQDNCNLIIQNIFREHTARRYIQGSAQKFKFSPTYMAPIALNTTSLIGWTCLGIGLIGVTICGALYLFQRAERKRYQNYEIVTISAL